jgi:hypothetical protein
MLRTFHVHMKPLATQNKQRSLGKLTSLRAQTSLSHRLKRRHDSWIRTQSVPSRFERSQLSQAFGVMSLTPALQFWLHICPWVICFKQERVYHVREEVSVGQEQRLVRV